MESRGSRSIGESASEAAHETSRGATVGVAAWVGADGESLAAALAGEHANEVESDWRWNIVAIGGERRAAAAAWAGRTGAAEVGSIRELARPGVGAVLVIGRDVASDDELRLLLEGDRTVVLAAGGDIGLTSATALGERLGRVAVVPSFALAECWRIAAPIVEEFCSDGAVSAISVRMRTRHGERSVDALLADACGICVSLMAPAESVVAIGRLRAESSDAQSQPQSQVQSLAALVRATNGAIAAIDVADGGGWLRECELIGPGGRIRITDGSIERWNRQGIRTEQHAPAGPDDLVTASIEALRSFARNRRGRLDPDRLLPPLAMSEAAKLSVRTGNAESPDRVYELAGRP